MLSIIIPTFNCEKYVGEMIDSIISQTFTNWELILVDDGSTDGTHNILNEYQQKNSRIRWYKRERLPKGACTCRNIGFEESNNPQYVIWFDADDVIAPYCFEQRVGAMESHPEMDFMIFPAKSFRSNPNDRANRYYGVRIFDEDVVNTFLSSANPPFVGWTNIYRHESLLKYNLKWDENLLSKQDTDFNLQAIFKGCRFMYAENVGVDYYYRVIPNSISHSIFKKNHFSSHIYLLKKISACLEEKEHKEYEYSYLTYIIHFACLFAKQKGYRYIDDLVKLDTIKNRIYFVSRIRLLTKVPDKCIPVFAKLLFPILYYNRKKRLAQYKQYIVRFNHSLNK